MNSKKQTQRSRTSSRDSRSRFKSCTRLFAITAAIFALNPYAITPASADTDQPPSSAAGANAESANSVNQGITNIENSVDEIDTYIDKQKTKFQEQQEDLEKRKALDHQSEATIQLLKDQINAQEQYLDTFKKNWRDYKGNVHAMQAEMNARKYLPWLYAVAAVLLFKRDTVQDNALVGLAGYGTGDLIEQTGYGIAHFGTKLVYSF